MREKAKQCVREIRRDLEAMAPEMAPRDREIAAVHLAAFAMRVAPHLGEGDFVTTCLGAFRNEIR